MNIKEIEILIVEAREAYYNEDNSSLTDEEYDALVDQLRDLDPKNKLLAEVGAKPASNWPKVKHDIPMGSLDKVQNEEEFVTWWNKLGVGIDEVVVTDKLDGISIELQYVMGNLVKAITRGDGETGEDITQNVAKMKGFKNLANVGTVSIRGEIVLFRDTWKKHMPDKKNPRNAAAGTAKRLDGTGCEHLSILCYDMIPTPCDTYEQTLCHLLDNGFATPTYSKINCSYVPRYVGAVFQNRATTPYDIDGAVVRVNSLILFTKLGDLNMNPRGAVAYKPPPEVKATTIRDVTWQIGRTGRITPVAEIVPIDIGGTTISRVSLHTAKNALALRAGAGASVLVSRRNDVIPTLEKIIKESPISAPSRCPVCDYTLEWEGEYLTCINNNCPNILFSSIMVWTKTLGILFWGESFIQSIINNELIHNLPDIYKLNWNKVSEIVGDGVASRAKDQLDQHKKIDMSTLISALNIRNCK